MMIFGFVMMSVSVIILLLSLIGIFPSWCVCVFHILFVVAEMSYVDAYNKLLDRIEKLEEQINKHKEDK